MANTLTKRDIFTLTIDALNTYDVADKEVLIAGLQHEIELLDRKASTPRKPTATQVENESLKADLLAYLTAEDKPLTIKEIQEGCSTFTELSNQRMSHLLTALVKDEKVDKTYVKKTPFYSAK